MRFLLLLFIISNISGAKKVIYVSWWGAMPSDVSLLIISPWSQKRNTHIPCLLGFLSPLSLASLPSPSFSLHPFWLLSTPPHFLSLPSPIPKQVHLYLLMAPPPPPPPSHVSFLCLHFPSLTPESSPFLSLNLQSCFPSFPSPLPFLLMSIAILGPSLVSLVISTSQHPQ